MGPQSRYVVVIYARLRRAQPILYSVRLEEHRASRNTCWLQRRHQAARIPLFANAAIEAAAFRGYSRPIGPGPEFAEVREVATQGSSHMKKFAIRAMFGLWIAAAPFAIVGCDEPAKTEPAKTGTPPPAEKKPEEKKPDAPKGS
jgi:hypothetical protein